MSNLNMEDEYQTPLNSNIPMATPVEAALSHQAQSDAYEGGQIGSLDNAELSNIEQRLRDAQDEKDYMSEMFGKALQVKSSKSSEEFPRRNFRQPPRNQEEAFADLQDEDRQMYLYNKGEKALEQRLKSIISSSAVHDQIKKGGEKTRIELDKVADARARDMRASKRSERSAFHEQKYDGPPVAPAVPNQSPSLNSERTPVRRQNNVQEQRRKTPTETQLPPGGRIPGYVQGTPNYVASSSSSSGDDSMASSRSSNNFPNNFPTERKVQEDQRRVAPAERKLLSFEMREKMNDMKLAVGGLGALTDQLTDKFGGIEGYLTSIYDLIEAGVEPADILENTINDLYDNAPTDFWDDVNERDGRMRDVLDEAALLDHLGPDVEPSVKEQILNEARTAINRDRPDQGGAPLSASTGETPDENPADHLGSYFDPENDGYPRTRGGGGGGGEPPRPGVSTAPPGDGGGGPGPSGGRRGASFQALQNLNQLAPHIASMLTNNAMRPLIIKREQIPSIYPPLPKHTNLPIVQQAIARYQEDASLLNVYFS